MSKNFYLDNEDLRYYVERGVEWGPLVELTERWYSDPDGFKDAAEAVSAYRDVLELVGEYMAQEVAPRWSSLDREHPHKVGDHVVHPPVLERVFEGMRALGLHGLCVPRELDGMNFPLLTYMFNAEMIARADASVMTHYGFHGGIAMALLVYSIHEGTTRFDTKTWRMTQTRFEAEIRDIVHGDAWGSMDITEPDAGSDMGALRTRGEQDEEGRWYVTGQKIFITSGHGKYHVVIARTEPHVETGDPAEGLKGLSLFLVPAWEGEGASRRDHVVVDRLEEKLGHHASATCAVSFERSPAQLIGERGQGFKQMLLLMNNARVGVGFEGLGVCEAAWRLARAYAAERRAFGKAIDQHEMIAELLEGMKTDIQGIRALAVHAAWHEEMTHKIDIALRCRPDMPELERRRLERELTRCKAVSRRVTPLLKYLSSERAVALARQGMQIHGGVGYTQDYEAEKLLRDALVLPVYEGTSQIQALMAMKDTLGGIVAAPQAFLRRLAEARVRSVSARDPLERGVARVQYLSLSAQQHLMTRTVREKLRSVRGQPVGSWAGALRERWDPKRDFAFAMLHAERLIQLLADEAVCEVLLAQAARHPERAEVLERWLERCEPRARHLHDVITTTGERLLARLHGEADAPAAQ